LQKDEELLADARLLLERDRRRSAADRTYYAMFAAAQAALLQKGITAKTHKGLKSQFSREFVKTGIVDRARIRDLEETFDARQASAYEAEFRLARDVLERYLEQAEAFIDRVTRLVEREERTDNRG
jgi:uncharacterized protein (UPF0332 family)